MIIAKLQNCAGNATISEWVDFPESQHPPAWAFPSTKGERAKNADKKRSDLG